MCVRAVSTYRGGRLDSGSRGFSLTEDGHPLDQDDSAGSDALGLAASLRGSLSALPGNKVITV